MNKEDKKVYNDLQKKLLKCKYYEDEGKLWKLQAGLQYRGHQSLTV